MNMPTRKALRTCTRYRLRRLGGGLRSWLGARWTCAPALYLTAPPSCGGSAGPPCGTRFPLMACTTAGTSSLSPRDDAAGEREPTDRVLTEGSNSEASAERIARIRRQRWRRQLAEAGGARLLERGTLEPRRSRHYPVKDREQGTPGSEPRPGVGLAMAAASPAFALRKVGRFLLFVGAGSGFESSTHIP